MIRKITIILTMTCMILGVFGYFLAAIDTTNAQRTAKARASKNLLGGLLSGGGALDRPEYVANETIHSVNPYLIGFEQNF